MTETTRRLRQSAVIVDSTIPSGMTIPEYQRTRGERRQPKVRRWLLWHDPQTRVSALYES